MFLSIGKSCCCRWKTRKKAKNQPTNQPTKQKNTAPKIVTNVYSPVPIIGQTRKKFQTFFPSSHSDVSRVASLEPERRGPQGWNVECWGSLQHVDASVTPDGPGVARAISLSPPKSGYWLAFLEEIQANCTQMQWNLWSVIDFQTPWAPCVPWTEDFNTGTFLSMTSAMDYRPFGSVVLQEFGWVLGLKAMGEEVMGHKPWMFLLVHWLWLAVLVKGSACPRTQSQTWRHAATLRSLPVTTTLRFLLKGLQFSSVQLLSLFNPMYGNTPGFPELVHH